MLNAQLGRTGVIQAGPPCRGIPPAALVSAGVMALSLETHPPSTEGGGAHFDWPGRPNVTGGVCALKDPMRLAYEVLRRCASRRGSQALRLAGRRACTRIILGAAVSRRASADRCLLGRTLGMNSAMLWARQDMHRPSTAGRIARSPALSGTRPPVPQGTADARTLAAQLLRHGLGWALGRTFHRRKLHGQG